MTTRPDPFGEEAFGVAAGPLREHLIRSLSRFGPREPNNLELAIALEAARFTWRRAAEVHAAEIERLRGIGFERLLTLALDTHERVSALEAVLREHREHDA